MDRFLFRGVKLATMDKSVKDSKNIVVLRFQLQLAYIFLFHNKIRAGCSKYILLNNQTNCQLGKTNRY